MIQHFIFFINCMILLMNAWDCFNLFFSGFCNVILKKDQYLKILSLLDL